MAEQAAIVGLVGQKMASDDQRDAQREKFVQDSAGKVLDTYLDSPHAKQSMDTERRGGVMANYSCFVKVTDRSGNIEGITYDHPQDGEWKNKPKSHIILRFT